MTKLSNEDTFDRLWKLWKTISLVFCTLYVILLFFAMTLMIFIHIFGSKTPKMVSKPLSDVPKNMSFADIEFQNCIGTCLKKACPEVQKTADPQYGLFIDRPPVPIESTGRIGGDLEDTAVLLECTNFNDTMRWLKGIIKSRISDNDLWVYIHFGFSVTEDSMKQLRREIKMNKWNKGIHVSRVVDAKMNQEVLRVSQKKYLISIQDTDYMGVDFADFYFLGKTVMELDDKVNCVCGGDSYKGNHTDEFFKPDQGDLLWLSHINCTKSLMTSRKYYTDENYHLNTCLRPEEWRVSDSAQHVTKENYKLAHYDPNLLTTEKFMGRLFHDFRASIAKPKIHWNELSSMDSDKIYVFRYDDSRDLRYYFDDELVTMLLDTKIFEVILMMHYKGHQVYIEKVYYDL